MTPSSALSNEKNASEFDDAEFLEGPLSVFALGVIGNDAYLRKMGERAGGKK